MEIKNNPKVNLISQGYESLPFGVEKVVIDSPTFIYKDQAYGVREYAFQFPYYWEGDDLFEIGRKMKELEINATYGQDNLMLLEFHGKTLPVGELLHFDRLWVREVNRKCGLFLQRHPLEVGKDTFGKWYVYTRFGIIMEEEKDGKDAS